MSNPRKQGDKHQTRGFHQQNIGPLRSELLLLRLYGGLHIIVSWPSDIPVFLCLPVVDDRSTNILLYTQHYSTMVSGFDIKELQAVYLIFSFFGVVI